MRARPDVRSGSREEAQNEFPLQEAPRDLLRRYASDLEADQSGLCGPGRPQRHARKLGEQVHEQVGAVPDPLEARLSPLVDRRGEAPGERGTHRRGLEAPRVLSQLVVALQVEGRRVGEGEEADVRAGDFAPWPDVEGAHTLGTQDPLVAGEGVHVGAGRRRVHGDVADGLGAVYEGQYAPFARARRSPPGATPPRWSSPRARGRRGASAGSWPPRSSLP